MLAKMERKLLIICTMLILMPGLRAHAAGYKEVSGTAKYDYAFEVLNLVNTERQKAGTPLLAMDKSMLDSAMERAAETTVLFSHTRPDGSTCFSINSKIYGENIAYGQSSPKDVMNSWMNSKGHKENIMNSSYKSIGIGCIQKGNCLYWVQVFGFDKAEDVSCPQNKNVKYKVSLGNTQDNDNDSKDVDNSDADNSDAESNYTFDENTSQNDTNVKPKKVKGLKANSDKKKITMKWDDNSNADGYQLQISGNKQYKKSEQYFIGSKSKLVLKYFNGKKLKSHKKYYVRIRSFVINDKGVTFSKWKDISIRVK